MCKDKKSVPNAIVHEVTNLNGEITELVVPFEEPLVIITCPVNKCGCATAVKLSADKYKLLEVDGLMNVEPAIDCRKTPHCISDRCCVIVKDSKMIEVN